MSSKKTEWGNAPFEVTTEDGKTKTIRVNGRVRWALECLLAAGEKGCTPITTPGPRWSQYVHRLRGDGVNIETVREPHGGPFAGSHARYVLHDKVRRLDAGGSK